MNMTKRRWHKAINVTLALALVLMLAAALLPSLTTQAYVGTGADGHTRGYWRFNESSGTSAADSSGRSNTGALNNMDDIDWVWGKYGYALDFDGDDD